MWGRLWLFYLSKSPYDLVTVCDTKLSLSWVSLFQILNKCYLQSNHFSLSYSKSVSQFTATCKCDTQGGMEVPMPPWGLPSGPKTWAFFQLSEMKFRPWHLKVFTSFNIERRKAFLIHYYGHCNKLEKFKITNLFFTVYNYFLQGKRTFREVHH